MRQRRFEPPVPTHRELRGYAFDPSLSIRLETADINDFVYRIPWENLEPGPVGEYLEVIDYDPTVGNTYESVNLDHSHILATKGLAPSESNPQFHQQMVYAVAMLTINNFEKALGRKVFWSTRLMDGSADEYERWVQKLRIYPHALREANAYYSPMKKALLFGYFGAQPAEGSTQMPGSLVFTCLSHDIIAHEVTHAILDGLHRNYNRPTNPDVLAFHEAFADLVALFQHFTFPEVLKDQIGRTRGDLEKQSLLGQLAQEFGAAIGHYGSLRDALGKVNKKGEWELNVPDPEDYRTVLQPHARGSILVSAIFEAFLSIYKTRIQDLLRIATGGTGVLPEGELHPDLVNRLAGEASKTAGHILTICIRALDYCPPVDITFGDYLRAIITADFDLNHDDRLRYRLAFIEAFRRRGIYPEGLRTLSEESLRFPKIDAREQDGAARALLILRRFLTDYRKAVLFESDRKKLYDLTVSFIESDGGWGLHRRVRVKGENNSPQFENLTGLVFEPDWRGLGLKNFSGEGRAQATFQILNLRAVARSGPDGHQVHQVIFGLVQRIGAVFDQQGQLAGYYDLHEPVPEVENSDFREVASFEFREVQGGCTMVFDLESDSLYAISKPLVLTDPERRIARSRIEAQYEFREEALPLCLSELSAYFGQDIDFHLGEPFSFLHSC
jgi:hypothetical protein